MTDLTGKTAVVTGGSKGIGRAIAEALVRNNASVVIAARKIDEVQNAVSDLRQKGGSVAGFVCDVRDHNQVKTLFSRQNKRFKELTFSSTTPGLDCSEVLKR